MIGKTQWLIHIFMRQIMFFMHLLSEGINRAELRLKITQIY